MSFMLILIDIVSKVDHGNTLAVLCVSSFFSTGRYLCSYFIFIFIEKHLSLSQCAFYTVTV